MQELFRGSPALMMALPVALIVYLGWKRTRYFGNTAPLLIAVLLLGLEMAAPNFSGEGFALATLTFLFVFVAGIFSDLLETRRGMLVLAAISGLLLASAFWNILELARAR